MREKTADGDVVDGLPITFAEIGGKAVEVSGVGLDGVRGGIAPTQMAEEVVGRALDDGAWIFQFVTSHMTNSPRRRHGGSPFTRLFLPCNSIANKTRIGMSPCFRVSVVNLALRSRSRMMLRIHAFQAVERHVGINLRGRNVGVAEDGLHGAQIGAVLDHMRRAGMPEHVGADVASGRES